MTSLLDAPLLVGLLLSWSLAATPGPANALIAQESARRGFRAGWLTGLGAIAGDALMFVLMWLGVRAVVERYPAAFVVLGLAGSVLAWFAWGAWRAARRVDEVEAEGRGSFRRSFLIVVTSPLNWGWWLTVGASLFAEMGLVLVVGFFVGLLAWVAFWSGLTRLGASRVSRFAEMVGYASAVVLAAFAVYVGWTAVREGAALLD